MNKKSHTVSFESGEDVADIEHKVNWTDEMPDEIANFEPVTDINDDNWSNYEDVDD